MNKVFIAIFISTFLSANSQLILRDNEAPIDIQKLESKTIAVSDINTLGRYRSMYYDKGEIKLFATKKIKEKWNNQCSIIDHNVPLNAGDTDRLIAFFERYGYRFAGQKSIIDQNVFSQYGAEFFGINLSRSDMQFEEYSTNTFTSQQLYLIFKKK